MATRTEPTKAQIKKWCTALRSGKYKQGRGSLEDDNHRFCCLGVAVKVFIANPHKYNGILKGGMPDCQPNVPKWLSRVDDDFQQTVMAEKGAADTSESPALVTLNDSRRFTFDEIADCLEAVYIHEVLK